MPIVINPESELGKELCKWEQHHTKYVGPDQVPGNPYVFRPYPRMIYRAVQNPNGKYICMDVEPPTYLYASAAEYERACLQVAAFNQQCSLTVHSDGEYQRRRDEGWSDSPKEAMAKAEAIEEEIGRAAAEAAFHAQRMSDKARRELDAADASTHAHVIDVKGSGKRRGRKPKAVAPSDPELD